MDIMLIMDDVIKLLMDKGQVLVYNINTVQKLKEDGHTVTPRYEDRVDIDECDRIGIRKELIGYMVEM